jgi:hypothetical protein
MGSKKPMAELVVAPKMVIIVPILVIGIDPMKETQIMARQAKKFCILLNLVSLKPNTSSSESLVGRTQKGVAKVTTRRMAKRAM